MEILTSVRRLYISFKSLVNNFVYSFGRAALLLLVEVQNHIVPVWERGRIRVNTLLLRELKLPVARPKLNSCRYEMLDSADTERAVISVKLWTCVLQYFFRISHRSSAILSFSVIIVNPSTRECFLPNPFQFMGHLTFR